VLVPVTWAPLAVLPSALDIGENGLRSSRTNEPTLMVDPETNRDHNPCA